MLKKTSVVSSNISEVQYDTDEEQLHVIFSSGITYIYESVPETEYQLLINAKSVGSYFNKSIKSNYTCRRA